MTKNDELVMRLLMTASEKAGYAPRRAAEGFVGVIAPAKVCRLLEAIHGAVVKELDLRDAEVKLLTKEVERVESDADA